MAGIAAWKQELFQVTPERFEELALQVFRLQYGENPVYRAFVDALRVEPGSVNQVLQIPFLPVRFFRTHRVQTAVSEARLVFESSGTTAADPSRHYVYDPGLYEESFTRGFEAAVGRLEDFCIVGLVPSPRERPQSSLGFMVNGLIRRSQHPQGGFYLDRKRQLLSLLPALQENAQQILLIGLSHALMDFAEFAPLPLRNTLVIETGGMKGRRRELTREELHGKLCEAFNLEAVGSEYGMTELLSQAWALSSGLFIGPPWMRVLVREENDPRAVSVQGTGAINIIDLANIYSCSFLATDDLGRVRGDGKFEVLGRIDNTDLRGCSLLVA